MDLRIDVRDGTVNLPNGLSLGPAQTRNSVRTDPRLAAAKVRTGAPPWLHVDFAAGPVDGHTLLVTATFCAQRLMSVSFTVDVQPGEHGDWRDHSHVVDAATKALHDRLVTQMLGEPAATPVAVACDDDSDTASRLRPKWWDFPWGRVGSLHDGNGGGTMVRVDYEGRNTS